MVASLALRTDLDRFSTEKAKLVSHHAYWSTHGRLGSLYTHLALAAPPRASTQPVRTGSSGLKDSLGPAAADDVPTQHRAPGQPGCQDGDRY